MDFGVDKTKQTYGGTKEDDRILLEKLAKDGLVVRYGKRNKAAEERLTKELKVVNDLGFNSYFLINHDIVQYAHNRGFFHVGRGSGANSIIAYCLKITDVDPIELHLFFERFLNPDRPRHQILILIFPILTGTRSLIIFLNAMVKAKWHCWVLTRHSNMIQSYASLEK